MLPIHRQQHFLEASLSVVPRAAPTAAETSTASDAGARRQVEEGGEVGDEVVLGDVLERLALLLHTLVSQHQQGGEGEGHGDSLVESAVCWLFDHGLSLFS